MASLAAVGDRDALFQSTALCPCLETTRLRRATASWSGLETGGTQPSSGPELGNAQVLQEATGNRDARRRPTGTWPRAGKVCEVF